MNSERLPQTVSAQAVPKRQSSSVRLVPQSPHLKDQDEQVLEQMVGVGWLRYNLCSLAYLHLVYHQPFLSPCLIVVGLGLFFFLIIFISLILLGFQSAALCCMEIFSRLLKHHLTKLAVAFLSLKLCVRQKTSLLEVFIGGLCSLAVQPDLSKDGTKIKKYPQIQQE